MKTKSIKAVLAALTLIVVSLTSYATSAEDKNYDYAYYIMSPKNFQSSSAAGKTIRMTGKSGETKSVSFQGSVQIPSSIKVNAGLLRIGASSAYLIFDNVQCLYSTNVNRSFFNFTYPLVSCTDGSRANQAVQVNSKISIYLKEAKLFPATAYADLKILNTYTKGISLPQLEADKGQILRFDGDLWVPTDYIPDGQTSGDVLMWDGAGWTASKISAATGAAGAQGEKGDKGDKGDTGLTGLTGERGPTGLTGLTGQTGAAGAAGAVGAKGATGAAGAVGPAGATGAAGVAGAKGDKGDAGAAGAVGAAGAKGATGPAGATGAAGAAGVAGAKGDKGDTGAAGAAGAVGPAGATGAAGVAGAKGDKGDAGAAGATGAVGPAGATGAAGVAGAKGDKGDAGATGAVGPAGARGDKGDAGATGVAGPAGATGSAGVTGAKGDKGDAGPAGPAGSNGVAGVKGDKGDVGATGAQGLQGEAGTQGAAGLAGAAGATGVAGAKGDTGATGATGAQGPQGIAGANGLNGAAGIAGAKGDAGDPGTVSLTAGAGILGGTIQGNGGVIAVNTGTAVGQIPVIGANGRLPASIVDTQQKIVYIKDVKTSGTNGSACDPTKNFEQIRDLNSISGDTSFAGVAGNTITLAAGTYDIDINAPAYLVGLHKAILANATTGEVVLIGSSARSHNVSGGMEPSRIVGTVTLTQSTPFVIKHRCATLSTAGFGIATAFGVDEVYTQVIITKEK